MHEWFNDSYRAFIYVFMLIHTNHKFHIFLRFDRVQKYKPLEKLPTEEIFFIVSWIALTNYDSDFAAEASLFQK